MTQNRILRLLSLAILCVLPACPAIVAYTDLASWQAVSTQAGATVEFTNLALNPGDSSATVASIVYADPGITFTAPTDSVQVRNPLSSELWFLWGTGAIIYPANGSVLKVEMTTAVTAFATNMMIYNGTSGSNMTVTVMSGTTSLSSPTLATSAQPTPTFFGVVSDAGQTFDSVTFTPETARALLDNVRVGSYLDISTPEPGTGFLVFGGAALMALGLLRKRC